jgi:GNAT superfamily N-acetyltransferase
MTAEMKWRGGFTNDEVNRLHAEAFNARVFDASEWNWEQLVAQHSLGWVTARIESDLVGFLNVLWDGSIHAWIQDVMVVASARHRGIGRQLVDVAAQESRNAGCEWLHVDFEDELRPFYFDACGFTPTNAGLLRL